MRINALTVCVNYSDYWNKEDLAKMFAERKSTGGIASMERLNN